MTDTKILNHEQYAARRYELPDGGRWTELVEGQVVALQPPDVEHGTAVFNFSKALAVHLQSLAESAVGYACFDLGLLVARDPDTVRFPAVSYFTETEQFSEFDQVLTQTRPELIVEVASTNVLRRQMSRRIEEYLAWGISMVWVIDPIEKQIHLLGSRGLLRQYSQTQTFSGDPTLPGFEFPVTDLFAEPDWWRG